MILLFSPRMFQAAGRRALESSAVGFPYTRCKDSFRRSAIKKLWQRENEASIMNAKSFLSSLGFFALLASGAFAQTTGDRIDLYFGDWHTTSPRMTQGTLEERDILTRGDAMNPKRVRFSGSSTPTLTLHWRRMLRRHRSNSTASKRFALCNPDRERRMPALSP